MTDPPDPGLAGPDPPRHGALGWARRSTADLTGRARAFLDWLTSHRASNPLIDFGLLLYERDGDSAGTVLGAAVAFRLFLFFVPYLLFVVGIAGFLADHLDASTVSQAAGVSGTMAAQIESAFSQGGTARWVATIAGLLGMAWAGRSLTKVLVASAALSWRVPGRQKTLVRVVGVVAGLMASMALVAALVDRIRQHAGFAVAGVSFILVAAFYLVAWFFLLLVLPRTTRDPSALLPGALLIALTVSVMQAVTQLYLPHKMNHASVYGAIGITIVTLGWFFFMGRVIVFGMSLNAVLYERFGSISTFVFGLPLLRRIPQRWAAFARFFGLEERGEPAPASPGSPTVDADEHLPAAAVWAYALADEHREAREAERLRGRSRIHGRRVSRRHE